MEYIIKSNIKHTDYSIFICLKYQSIYDYLPIIQKNISNGLVLIDCLLITGDNENRFIKLSISNGIIDMNSFKYEIPSSKIIDLCEDELALHPNEVTLSILSRDKKNQILAS